MADRPHPRVGREPEHRVAERVKQRQDADQAIVRQDAIDLADRLDVGIDVEVRQDDALGLARAAAAEDDGGGVVDRRPARGAGQAFQQTNRCEDRQREGTPAVSAS